MIVPLDRGKPLTDQIYVHFRDAILARRLDAGARLPATRELAQQLAVARNTIVAVYTRLELEGYVEARGRRGTRVSTTIPSALPDASTRRRPAGRVAAGTRLSSFGNRLMRAPDVFPAVVRRDRAGFRYDFLYNVTVADRASRRAWYRILRRCAAQFEATVPAYDLTGKPDRLQHAIARYVGLARGVRCDARQVVVLSSIQQAFQLAARLLVEPGEPVAIEEPHRVGARNAFLAHGAQVIPIDSDDYAMRVDRLPENPPPRLVYVSPSHLWPSGTVLPLDRRLRLLDWARSHGSWILENDHNTEFTALRTPVMSLQGLDTAERVLYIGNFSRLISPDPCIAYVIVPPRLAAAFVSARDLDGSGPSLLEVEVLARFLDEGHLETLLRRTARRLVPLREALRDALNALPGEPFDVRATTGGLHLIAFPRDLRVRELAAFIDDCSLAGVGVFPDRPYYVRTPKRAGLIMGFAQMTPATIRAGVAQLARVYASRSRT